MLGAAMYYAEKASLIAEEIKREGEIRSAHTTSSRPSAGINRGRIVSPEYGGSPSFTGPVNEPKAQLPYDDVSSITSSSTFDQMKVLNNCLPRLRGRKGRSSWFTNGFPATIYENGHQEQFVFDLEAMEPTFNDRVSCHDVGVAQENGFGQEKSRLGQGSFMRFYGGDDVSATSSITLGTENHRKNYRTSDSANKIKIVLLNLPDTISEEVENEPAMPNQQAQALDVNATKTNQLPEKKSKAEALMENLKDAIKTDEEREQELEYKRVRYLFEAKQKYVDGNTPAATRAMRRAKLIALEQEKISAAIEAMEEQLLSIESSLHSAMIVGKISMAMHGSSDESILGEIKESTEYAADVMDILSESPDPASLDNENLLAELAALLATPGV